MEDVKIMENMKEVLKKARRSKHKKSRGAKDKSKVDPEEDAISDILNRNWVFSSPPSNNAFKQENGTPSPKVNAFERMMSKKSEPLSQISPELNGTKKKKSAKKPMHNRLDSDNGNHSDNSTVDENKEAPKSGKSKFVDSPTTMLKFLKGSVTNAAGNQEKDEAVEDSSTRKRLRTAETPTQVNGSHKKRKTKVERLLLDSNENPIHAEPPAASQEHNGSPTYQSGRPRRSCAGNVNYETLISPDKAGKAPEGDDPTSKRPKRTKQSAKANDSDEIWALDDDSPIKDTKPVKLAPLFVKKLPKPSIDPVVKEARRNFLLSGLPENLRNAIDKQKQYEDEILSNELIAFPSISHVTQQQSTLNGSEVPVLWENSVVKINADDVNECEHNGPLRFLRKGSLTGSSDDVDVPVICEEIRSIERTSIKHGKLKELVKRLKERFEGFPTNRCFKQLFRQYKNATRDDSDSDYYSDYDNASIEENLLFVDIFKPKQFEEFFINAKPVNDLKEFLLNWNDKSEEYDSDESGSRQSSREMNNFAVLTGVNGVGKTSSVYALAKDLNYQVIEINAGSRRSGKKMLQDLFEATQSHRVKNKSGKKCSTQEDSENSQGDEAPAAKSIILVEDAELVFESDEGFVSSIQQLINISKRPVLLTTNNRSCQHLQKYIQHNEIMFERPRKANHIAKYLSLLCLAANYQINESALEHLFALNEHDLRKTINEIEFFIRSANTRSNDGDLMALYGRPRRERSTRGKLSDGNVKSLSALSFDTSIASSCAAMFVERADTDGTSYHHRHLMDEMAEFFASRCNVAETQRDLAHGKQKIIESSFSDHLIGQSATLSATRSSTVDYDAMLREVCRAEKARSEVGRRTANNRGHYLRFLIAPNSFGNDYFNEQCEMFQQ